MLLRPPSRHSSRNRGDSSSNQQLEITETKLKTSKATWDTRQQRELFAHKRDERDKGSDLLTCHTPMLATGGEKGLRKRLQIL